MVNKIYRFERAEKEDIKDIAEIEAEFFGDYSKAFNYPFLEKWYNYNKDMFYVVKNNENKVLAFTIMTPITEKLYNRMLTGEINDMYDFDEQDVLKEKQSEFYYVSDICASKKRNEKGYFSVVSYLMAGLVDFLSQYSHYILTSPVTKEGTAVCKNLGFREVAVSNFDGKSYSICELIADDKTKTALSKFSRILKR